MTGTLLIVKNFRSGGLAETSSANCGWTFQPGTGS
jgi:hypothetical protein